MDDIETGLDTYRRIETLERIIRAAIANGYHACDESVGALDEPRYGCRCWIAEAKAEVPIE